jgi:hypothetical protein
MLDDSVRVRGGALPRRLASRWAVVFGRHLG